MKFLSLAAGAALLFSSFLSAADEVLLPPDQQVFIRNIGSEPASIDPQLAEESAGSDVINDLFEGLYRLDEQGKPQPAGAVSYQVDASAPSIPLPYGPMPSGLMVSRSPPPTMCMAGSGPLTQKPPLTTPGLSS